MSNLVLSPNTISNQNFSGIRSITASENSIQNNILTSTAVMKTNNLSVARNPIVGTTLTGYTPASYNQGSFPLNTPILLVDSTGINPVRVTTKVPTVWIASSVYMNNYGPNPVGGGTWTGVDINNYPGVSLGTTGLTNPLTFTQSLGYNRFSGLNDSPLAIGPTPIQFATPAQTTNYTQEIMLVHKTFPGVEANIIFIQDLINPAVLPQNAYLALENTVVGTATCTPGTGNALGKLEWSVVYLSIA